MKRFLSILCAAAMIIGLFPTTALADGADFSLGMSVNAVEGSTATPRTLSSLRAGDTVTVTVTIPAGISINTIGVIISFDKTIFECNNAVAGSAISVANGWNKATISTPLNANANGYAGVATTHTDDSNSPTNTTTLVGALTLCTATFTVRSDVSGIASFSIAAEKDSHMTQVGYIDTDQKIQSYIVDMPSDVSATVLTELSSLSLDALAIDIDNTAVSTVSGTGYSGTVAWTGVTGGSTISSLGTYTAIVTLSPTGLYYGFNSSAPITYGGTELSTSPKDVNGCSVVITSQAANQIVLTVSRTISAPVTAGTTYTEADSGSTTKISADYGTAKSATVTFTNSLTSDVNLTLTCSDATNFSVAAAEGSSMTGTVLTVPAGGNASVLVTLKAGTPYRASDYSTTISGAYTYGGDRTASATVSGAVSKAQAAITINPIGSLVYDGSPVTAGISGTDITYAYTGDGAVTVTWYADNSNVKGSALKGAPTEVGTYWIGVKADEGTNCLAVSEISQKFFVSAKSAVLTYSIANYTGDGSNASPYSKKYDRTAANANGNATFTVMDGSTDVSSQINGYTYTWYTKDGSALSGAPTGAGKYSVVISISDDVYAGATTVWFSINKAPVTPAIASVTSKTYDGTAEATGTLNLSGVVNGDTPTATGTFQWTSSAAETATVNVTGITLTGDSGSNYELSTNSLSEAADPNGAKITKRQLTASGTAVTPSKTYDGNTTAAVTDAGKLNNKIEEDKDHVTLHATAVYNDAKAGLNKTITVTYTIDGTAAGNYIAPTSFSYSDSTVSITPRQLTVSGTTATTSKIYDDNTDAAVTNIGTLGNLVDSDDIVILSAEARYQTPDVGTGKQIDVIYTISGKDADNYQKPGDIKFSEAGEITARQLTVSGTEVTTSKPNDGDTKAAVTNVGTLTNLALGDTLTLSATANYDSAATGTGKTITVIYTIEGTKAGNYIKPINHILTGEITKGGLSSITLSGTPTKAAYNDGETLNASGITVTAHYANESDNTVITNYTIIYDNGRLGSGNTLPGRDATSALACGDTCVTIAYGDKYCLLKDLNTTSTIIWQVNGATAETDAQVAYGAAPSFGGTASKPDTAAYSYVFLGWSSGAAGTIFSFDPDARTAIEAQGYTYAAVPAVTASVTYTAVFQEKAIAHSVTFYDADGTVLKTVTVLNGGNAVYLGYTPTKPSDSTNTYAFDKWVTSKGGTTQATLTNITLNTAVYASFKAAPIVTSTGFTVTFKNGANTLQAVRVKSGDTAAYTAAPPVRAASAQYLYTFDKWVTADGGNTEAVLTNISANMDVFASFTATLRSYTLVGVIDGIANSAVLPYGTSLASYTVNSPKKTSDAQYSYQFIGWNTKADGKGTALASDATVTGNAVYYAIFDTTRITYSVTWKAEGSPDKIDPDLHFGDIPSYEGSTPAQEGSKFLGWNDGTATYWEDALPAVTKNVTYTAVFTTGDICTLTFKNADGSTYAVIKAVKDDTPSAPANPALSGVQNTYTFSKWSDGKSEYLPTALPKVTGDAIYTAVYTSSPRICSVTWIVAGVSSTTTCAYGAVPSFSGTPTQVSPTDQLTYTFLGWKSGSNTYTGTLPAITGDTVYLAVFSPKATSHTLTVNYKYMDGTTDAAAQIVRACGYGQEYSIASPVVQGYTASDAVISGVMGSSDRTFTVTYVKNTYKLTVNFVYDSANKTTSGIAFSPVTVSVPFGGTVAVAVPAIAGQTAMYMGAAVAGTFDYTMADASDHTITVTYHAISYKVYLKLWNSAAGAPLDTAAYEAAFAIKPAQKTLGDYTGTDNNGLYYLTFEYGQALSLPAASFSGLQFSGWAGAPDTMPVGDTTLVGYFSSGAYRFVYRILDQNGKVLDADYYTCYAGSAEADLSSVENMLVSTYNKNNPTQHITGFHDAVIAMPEGSTVRVAEAVPTSCSLSITYQYSGGAVIGTYQAALPYGLPYQVTSPSVQGYTADKPVVSGTLTDNANIVVLYTKNNSALVVSYAYAGGSTAANSIVQDTPYGGTYSVVSSSIPDYTVSRGTVSGTMPDKNITENVFYSYSTGEKVLNIQYQYADGTPAAATYTAPFSVNQAYNVPSPVITGYSPDFAAVSGHMDQDGETVTVTYMPILYTLKITYQYADGTKLAAKDYGGIVVDANGCYTVTGNYNDVYSVASPVISGYAANNLSVSGTLTGNTNVTVIYTSTTPSGGGFGFPVPTPVPVGDISATVSQSNGNAELTFTSQDLQAAISATTDGDLTINLSDYEGVTSVTLPTAAAEAISTASASLTIRTDDFSMSLSSEVVKALCEQLGDQDKLSLSVVPVSADKLSDAQRASLHSDALILDLNAKIVVCDNKGKETGETKHGTISGEVSIRIPFTPAADQKASRIVVFRLKSDGKREYLRTTYENGSLTFWTDSFSIYVAAACPMVDYSDCDLNGWYHTAVDYALEKGFMTGTGAAAFSPAVPASRAMIVTVLWRLAGQPAGGTASFTDLAADWYKSAVAWAFTNGITTGKTATSFDPNGSMTREQFAAFLYRYAKFLGYDVSAKADLHTYTDAGSISGYAVSSVEWAVAEGIIEGRTQTTLVPGGKVTRAEMATMLMRFCENIVK